MPETRKYTNESVTVISNECVAPEHYCITLGEAEMARAARAGQFFQVRLKGESAPFLPRPFSIFDWHADDSGQKTAFRILYKVVGKGTAGLARLRAGDVVAVTGPLGNTFTPPEPGKKALIAAGGIGIAPFLAFLRECIEAGFPAEDVRLLYGARCQELLVQDKVFESLGAKVDIITDDGSCGVRGTVLDLLKRHVEGKAADQFLVYASGPTPMLDAVARYCQAKGVRGELSLEARMICGFGVCNSCAVAVNSDKAPDGWEYKLVCRDGPVFSAAALHVK